MDTPRKRWFYYIGSFFLVLAIPLTVYLVQQQQEIRQRAQEPTVSSPQETLSYPWDNPRSAQTVIPQVDASKKAIFTTLPFSSKTCEKKSDGDADCNNSINLADVSYWQIDYEKGTSRYADFNGDGKVTLTDYNIWRQNANLPSVPLVQKLSQKLGLERLFATTLWGFMPKVTRVFAQESSAVTVVDSSVLIASDIYRVMNQYGNQSYSIEEIARDSTDGQITYYAKDGQQIAQVNNFITDNTTMTTNVGGANIAVNRNEQGLVAQTSKDANGGFIANQIWPDTASYEQNQAPQAATLPTTTGFATLSVQPNNGGIMTQRDVNGKIIAEANMVNGSLVQSYDYRNGVVASSDGLTGITVGKVESGQDSSTMLMYRNILLGIIKKNKNGLFMAFAGKNKSWNFTSYFIDGKTSEYSIADISKESDPNFPELTELIANAKNVKPSRNTQFVGSFTGSDAPTAQIRAAGQLILASFPAVLGISTKAVLAETTGASVSIPSGGKKEDNGAPKDEEGKVTGPANPAWASVTVTFNVSTPTNQNQTAEVYTINVPTSSTGYPQGAPSQWGSITKSSPTGEIIGTINYTSAAQRDAALSLVEKSTFTTEDLRGVGANGSAVGSLGVPPPVPPAAVPPPAVLPPPNAAIPEESGRTAAGYAAAQKAVDAMKNSGVTNQTAQGVAGAIAAFNASGANNAARAGAAEINSLLGKGEMNPERTAALTAYQSLTQKHEAASYDQLSGALNKDGDGQFNAVEQTAILGASYASLSYAVENYNVAVETGVGLNGMSVSESKSLVSDALGDFRETMANTPEADTSGLGDIGSLTAEAESIAGSGGGSSVQDIQSTSVSVSEPDYDSGYSAPDQQGSIDSNSNNDQY